MTCPQSRSHTSDDGVGRCRHRRAGERRGHPAGGRRERSGGRGAAAGLQLHQMGGQVPNRCRRVEVASQVEDVAHALAFFHYGAKRPGHARRLALVGAQRPGGDACQQDAHQGGRREVEVQHDRGPIIENGADVSSRVVHRLNCATPPLPDDLADGTNSGTAAKRTQRVAA